MISKFRPAIILSLYPLGVRKSKNIEWEMLETKHTIPDIHLVTIFFLVNVSFDSIVNFIHTHGGAVIWILPPGSFDGTNPVWVKLL